MKNLTAFYSKYQTKINTNAEADYILTEDREQDYSNIQLGSNTTDLVLSEKTEDGLKKLTVFFLRDRDSERDLVLKLSELAAEVENNTDQLLELIWEKREELPEFN